MVRGRRAGSKSRGISNGLKNGNSFHNIEELSESYPPEVAEKYNIRQVCGQSSGLYVSKKNFYFFLSFLSLTDKEMKWFNF